MSCDNNSLELTDEQKDHVCGILSTGCDRQTAATAVGCSPTDISRAIQQDELFAERVRRAEATAELHHMRNVHTAARDEKHWRASVWWLERRSPEHYARREPGTVTIPQLQAFVTTLSDALLEVVHDDATRKRLVARLDQLAHSLEESPLAPDRQPEAATTDDSMTFDDERSSSDPPDAEASEAGLDW